KTHTNSSKLQTTLENTFAHASFAASRARRALMDLTDPDGAGVGKMLEKVKNFF
ncbi:unnamed protein product, partial [Amoebophrya sp. A25]